MFFQSQFKQPIARMSEIHWIADYKHRDKFTFGGFIQVNCSASELWDLLASPGHLMKVHPSCVSHETENWTGVGSKDFLTYKSGGKRIRTVTKWHPEELIELKVEDPISSKESQVSYTIKKITGKNNCELFIQIQTDEYKNIPRPFWKLYARKILLPRYKKYLEGPLMGFAKYKPELRREVSK
jgi:hypothetical protein